MLYKMVPVKDEGTAFPATSLGLAVVAMLRRELKAEEKPGDSCTFSARVTVPALSWSALPELAYLLSFKDTL